MSSLPNVVLSTLRTLIACLTRGKIVPQDPINEFKLDLNQAIIYLIPHQSLTDTLTLQLACKRAGLPDPLSPLEIDGKAFPRLHYLMDKQGETLEQTIDDIAATLQVHQPNPRLNAQFIPVKLFWDRYPGRESLHEIVKGKNNKAPGYFAKAWQIIAKGRENLVRFSHPVSMAQMAQRKGDLPALAHQLTRVARIHFSRMQYIATGPKLPNRRHLFEQLLASPVIRQAISEHGQVKNIDNNQATQDAMRYLDEIAADFSYRTLRIGERALSFVWNKIYDGISVNNAEAVRRLAQEGHEIVFAPCHRSHMDYLLLSYVLYHQGLVPPHIAAGINLNFWPAGPIFRRGGAFFIRRSFKGNKLYSVVFREYLNHLFSRGYSVEYFTEGGRSRTGRLLPPKTGMLAMTIQAMLRGIDRPVTIVPIYFGYEHVMEVSTYYKELKGQAKEKESIFSLFGIVRKLRNFGHGFVNFGQPIPLNQYLNDAQPDWRNGNSDERPSWLVPTVNNIAQRLMVNINSAAAVNGLCLSASVLTVAENYALPRSQLVTQIQLYLDLLRAVPYSQHVTLPDEDAEALLAHSLNLGKFQSQNDALGEIISLDEKQQVLLNFYRNNIVHLLIIPAIMASSLLRQTQSNKGELLSLLKHIYPLLQGELFMHYELSDLDALCQDYLATFAQAQLISINEDSITLNPHHRGRLALLARLAQESLHRYAVVAALAQYHGEQSRAQLEEQVIISAQRLAALHNVNAPEYYDKKVFNNLINLIKEQGWLDENTNTANTVFAQLSPLLTADVYESLMTMVKPS